MPVQLPHVPQPVPTLWQIDPSHSHVEFAVRHIMISSIKGRFSDIEGLVTMPNGDTSSASVDATIRVASIDTRETQRDAHLRSPDFLDVDRFPVMTFKSRRIDRGSGDAFALIGDLTMHGVTREIALDVVREGTGVDPWGNQRTGFSAKGTISRKDFGLTWNQILETGGLAVGDEVKIGIDAELVAKAAAA